MGQAHGASGERREQPANDARVRTMKESPCELRVAVSSYGRVGICLVIWFAAAYACRSLLKTFAPGMIDVCDAIFGVGTILLLMIVFGRFIWRLLWWLIGVVVIFTIIGSLHRNKSTPPA